MKLEKKKIEYGTKKKLEEYENNLYINLKEECNIQKLEIINQKVKELEEKYKNDLIQMKDKIKRELFTKYQNKNNQLIQEFEEAKNNLKEQREKEQKRIEQLNHIQNSYKIEEKFQKDKNNKINNLVKQNKNNYNK